MKILKIQRNKILFENNVEINLQKTTIEEYNLKEGVELDKDTYLELIERAALSFSYWLLAKRDYSIKEFTSKLMIKYREKNIIINIIKKFKELNYLNDEDFALSYINCHKNWGNKKLEYNLLLKGIDRNIIQNLLENNIEKELKEIEKLYIKMGTKEKKKKIESLMRKGFKYEHIKKIISYLEN